MHLQIQWPACANQGGAKGALVKRRASNETTRSESQAGELIRRRQLQFLLLLHVYELLIRADAYSRSPGIYFILRPAEQSVSLTDKRTSYMRPVLTRINKTNVMHASGEIRLPKIHLQ